MQRRHRSLPSRRLRTARRWLAPCGKQQACRPCWPSWSNGPAGLGTIADDAQQEAVEAAVPPRVLDQQQRQAVQGLLKSIGSSCLAAAGHGKNRHGVQDAGRGSQPQPQLRVHLSAPTGKAAARLSKQADRQPLRLFAKETLAGRLAGLPAPPCIRCWESQAGTLRRHRQHLWPWIWSGSDEGTDDPGQRPARKPCRGKPSCCWWESMNQLRPIDRGHSSGLDQAGSNAVGLGEAAITLTPHPIQVRSPPLPIGLRQGIAAGRQSEQLGATDNILRARAAPPGCRSAELKVRMRGAAGGAGPNAPRAFSPEALQALQQERPCCCSWEAFVGALAPAARPLGQKNSIGCCFEDQGGRGAASWPIGSRSFCHPATSPARIWPMAMSACSWQNSHRPKQCCSQAGGGNNQTRRCGWLHPALLVKGAECRLRPGPSTRPSGSGSMPGLWALWWPRSEVGELAWPLPGLTRARQEVVFCHPPGSRLAAEPPA